MPFVTNDFQSVLIDDEQYYQRNGLVADNYKEYVVAQKLYVWSKTSISRDYLSQRFKKYGDIQSTKILESGKEGLVTFKCDRHACLAYDREKGNCVKVASTWYQQQCDYWEEFDDESEDECEDELLELSPTSVPVLDLNDDCLFAIFDHCNHQSLVNLSDTCKRFDNLLSGGNYYFPNMKEFCLQSQDCKMSMTLADTRKVLRLMGSHFEKLNFWFDYIDDKIIYSYLQEVVDHYENSAAIIREMEFGITINDNFLNNNFFKLLTPILRNVHTLQLSVDDYNDQEIDTDFTELCPNLRKIILWDIFIVEKCLKTALPTLESFHWEYSWSELMSSLESFTFFSLNRQLKNFRCTEFDSENVSEIRLHMPNIEEINLFISEISSPNDFLELKKFKSLTKVQLSLTKILVSNSDKRKIIELFTGFHNLLELKLYFSEYKELPINESEKDQPVFALPRRLGNLERFDLLNVELDETTVVNFVRYTRSLKALHFHKCKISATESLIKNLMNVRKSKQQENKLTLYLDDDNKNNVFALSIADVQQYLSVKFNCKPHFSRFDS